MQGNVESDKLLHGQNQDKPPHTNIPTTFVPWLDRLKQPPLPGGLIFICNFRQQVNIGNY